MKPEFTEDQRLIIALLNKVESGIGLDVNDAEDLSIFELEDQQIVLISAESSHRLRIVRGDKFPGETES